MIIKNDNLVYKAINWVSLINRIFITSLVVLLIIFGFNWLFRVVFKNIAATRNTTIIIKIKSILMAELGLILMIILLIKLILLHKIYGFELNTKSKILVFKQFFLIVMKYMCYMCIVPNLIRVIFDILYIYNPVSLNQL